jgi:hypothetical protein
MPECNSPPCRAHDLVLVYGVAVLALGIVMVSRGVLPPPSAVHRVPPTLAALSRVAGLVPAPEERLVAAAPPAARVPTTAAPRSTSCKATTVFAACAPRLDLDHDLRLVLAVMALHRRRIPLVHRVQPAGYSGAPWPQDVPLKDSALASVEESVARAEASRSPTRRPMGLAVERQEARRTRHP